jgi:tetratricopeptide (TPR) repeat protein
MFWPLGCSYPQARVQYHHVGNQERRMRTTAIKFFMLAIITTALAAAPVIKSANAMGSDNPAPPPSSDGSKASSNGTKASSNGTKAKKKKNDKSSSIDDRRFLAGYHTAYATIYDRHDYAGAIEQLKTLGHDDRADVANLIGYSYRKLGDYKVSQIWYERALKADPNHVRTWQYYGLWQLEQGNREQAEYHLNKIASLAGTDSAEYRSLAAALEKPPGTGLVY